MKAIIKKLLYRLRHRALGPSTSAQLRERLALFTEETLDAHQLAKQNAKAIQQAADRAYMEATNIGDLAGTLAAFRDRL